jgi:hypothetical protein
MAAPTPANASGPKRATMTVSAMPNSVCMKFSPITGQAKLMTRRRSAARSMAGSGVWAKLLCMDGSNITSEGEKSPDTISAP